MSTYATKTRIPLLEWLNDRLPLVMGTCGLVSVACGYLMEAVRQRGDCEWGDPSPNTLGISVLMILLGGGAVGIIGVMVALFRSVREDRLLVWDLVLPACSLLAGASLFLFVNSGPGGWFQYCGS